MVELISHWYVIYVKSKHEFKVFERLTRAGIEVFLPAVERLRKWKDRKKLIKFPLFPGYLFVYIKRSYDLMLRVLKTPGVVNFLKNPSGEPAVVLEEEIILQQEIAERGKNL